MKIKRSIQCKAAFLMVVFSLNTLIGFACAVGMDMGFNTTLHHDKEVTIKPNVHVHSDGKKHVHDEKPLAVKHNHKKSHHHDKAITQPASKGDKDDCCNKKVAELIQTDKSVPSAFTPLNPVFFVAYISNYVQENILFSSKGNTSIKYFVRSYHPPIPDLRIAIQSFLI